MGFSNGSWEVMSQESIDQGNQIDGTREGSRRSLPCKDVRNGISGRGGKNPLRGYHNGLQQWELEGDVQSPDQETLIDGIGERSRGMSKAGLSGDR